MRVLSVGLILLIITTAPESMIVVADIIHLHVADHSRVVSAEQFMVTNLNLGLSLSVLSSMCDSLICRHGQRSHIVIVPYVQESVFLDVGVRR